MKTLGRALVLGAAFGLAAATTETWLNMIGFVQRRFGPGLPFFVQVAGLEIGLGILLGLVAAPLLRLRFGTLLHLAAMALAWFGLERWMSLHSPLFATVEIVTPLGGTVLALIGLGVARRRPGLAWAAGALLLGAGMAAPQIYLRATTPPQPAPPPRADARPGAPDVVLVVLDTVRARNLSLYGYGRETSPEMAAIAREGALFLDATSPSTWSLPSHASLFTGRYPSSHGAHGEHRYLDARFPTLADVLRHAGYETFCFTANPWISDGLGLTRGFDYQDLSWHEAAGAGLGFSFVHRLLDRFGLLEADKGGGLAAEHFEKWAQQRPTSGARPYFVFLNFIESHFPYHQLPHEYLRRFAQSPYGVLRAASLAVVGQQFGAPPPPLAETAPLARDMYDGGVAYANHLLGRVADALRARGTLDRTIFVVLADHGEILGERGGFFGHGPSLYQEAVGVPLVVRYPPRIPAGARVAVPVSTLGVLPTILELAGVDPLPTAEVGSLVPLATGAAQAQTGPILSEIQRTDSMGLGEKVEEPQMQADRRYRLLREGSLKLVESSNGDRFLYDLASDPEEQHELSQAQPQELARMEQDLEAARAGLGLPALDAPLGDTGAPALDATTRESLKALGYTE